MIISNKIITAKAEYIILFKVTLVYLIFFYLDFILSPNIIVTFLLKFVKKVISWTEPDLGDGA